MSAARTLSRSRTHRVTPGAVTLDVVYLRISLVRDPEEVATDRQLHEITERRMEEEHRTGVAIPTQVFRDDNISASLRKPRKGYEDMLALLRTRSAGTTRVWCYEPSRLTRHPMELEELIDVLERARASVQTVNGGTYDLTTPEGRMAARVVGAVARQEVERKGERQTSKHAEMARRGVMHSGPRPFGFVRNPDKGTKHDGLPSWVVVEEEAAMVREATERVLLGESVSAVTRDFNARGLRTNVVEPERAVQWTARNLRDKLLSPHVAALRIYDGVEHPGDESTGWVPLVPREDWHAVGDVLADPARERRAAATPYLLNGLVWTDTGWMMRGRGVARDRGHDGRYYTSAGTDGQHQPRAPKGEGCSVTEGDLDTMVLAAVFALTDAHAVGVPTVDFKRRAGLVARRQQLEAELDEALQLRKVGTIRTAREYAQLTAATNDELDVVLAQLQDVTPVDAGVAGVLANPGELRKRWDSLSFTTRRNVLRQLIERVVVARTTHRGPHSSLRYHPERVNVRWREA